MNLWRHKQPFYSKADFWHFGRKPGGGAWMPEYSIIEIGSIKTPLKMAKTENFKSFEGRPFRYKIMPK